MNLRLAVLATFVAALPLSVDAPTDSSSGRGQTRLEALGGIGQYGVVTRGCEGQVTSVVHRQLATGGLVVEHETPAGIVIGVRGGAVRHEQDERIVEYSPGLTYRSPGWSFTNRYVNPFVAYESRFAGIGAGWMKAEEDFLNGNADPLEAPVSAHLRFGDREATWYALRFMEDVPLESEGHLSMQLGFRPAERIELATGVGVLGPYDGALMGIRGRFWLTPGAAAQVRVSLSGNSQYNVVGGIAARWPARR